MERVSGIFPPHHHPPGIPYYRIPRDGTRRQAALSKGPILAVSGFDTGAGFHHIAKEVKG